MVLSRFSLGRGSKPVRKWAGVSDSYWHPLPLLILSASLWEMIQHQQESVDNFEIFFIFFFFRKKLVVGIGLSHLTELLLLYFCFTSAVNI